MTLWQARVALGAFVLLAAGISGNALLLQSARAPDGVAGKASPARADPERRAPKLIKPVVQAPGIETDPKAPPDESRPETVRAIQLELERRGYGPVLADGVMRPATRAAIMAFEHEHRLPLTGEATQGLLQHLVFGASVAAATVAAPEVKSPHAEAVIKRVQRLLAARGYRPGPIDGRLSAQTLAAIRAFETDQRLAAKGRISAAVLVRLEDGAAEAKKRAAR